MSNGNGHHWSKFIWRDHINDPLLRDCSLAAKGFWIGLLCMMHEGSPVGHLTAGGAPATPRQMASAVNCTLAQATKCLAELEAARVFSRTETGTIYSRRMVKDAEAAAKAQAWGKAGGNPNLKSQTTAQPPPEPGGVNPTVNTQAFRPLNPPVIPTLNQGLNGGVNPEVQEEKRRKEPPRSPPVTGGDASRGNSRNAAHDIAREMDAKQPITINAALSPQVVDFLEYTGAVPRRAGGASG